MSISPRQIAHYSMFQALKPKVKILGGKELVYREGETATIFAEVPSEPAADDIRSVLDP